MTIANLFSKRQQKTRLEDLDAHEHAQMPDLLRVEIAQILRDLLVIE
jgi:hypothetical protein